MSGGALEIHRLRPEHAPALGSFLAALLANGDGRWFHPHPLTFERARELCERKGQDLYYILLEDGAGLGYGMLRGWEEGFATPSLGIAIHPASRGRGLGTALMHFLHAAARARGATRVRLKTHPENSGAVELYRSLGYRFDQREGPQWIGTLELG